jgi:ketosteroid isomerase-like protein
MSEENVELVRSAFEALEQGGVDAMLEFCSPEIEYRVRRDLPDARTYRGHDGVRALAADWQRAFEDLRLGPEELIDVGDSVVGMMRISGRGAASGVEAGNPYAAVCAVRDGKIWRISDYPTREEALEAAGLRGSGS